MKTSGFIIRTMLILAVLTAGDSMALQVLYTAEDDTAPTATDKLTGDTAQDGTFVNGTTVVSDPKFGASAYNFGPVDGNPDGIDIPNSTSLGTAFTLAAFVRPFSTTYQRLFSDFSGNYSLIFDISPLGTTITDMRLIVNGVQVKSTTSTGFYENPQQYHHLAATYDDGTVNLYLDGVNVKLNATAGSGAITTLRNLRVADDIGASAGGTEQLYGNVDDILIYDRALSAVEITALAANGAEAFFGLSGGITECSITSPSDGDRFATGAGITIDAAASHTGNASVTNVEFYANGGLIGSDDTSPFSFSWSGMADGTYTLEVKAYSDDDSNAMSEPITVDVGYLSILYTAEGDNIAAIDKLTDDGGNQHGIFSANDIAVGTDAKYGSFAYDIGPTMFSTIELTDSTACLVPLPWRHI